MSCTLETMTTNAIQQIRACLLIVGAMVALPGCGERASPEGGSSSGSVSVTESEPVRLPPRVLGQELLADHYDLQGLIERGTLRVLVGYSRTHYFMDGLHIRGISAENLKQFDPFLQQQLESPRPKVNVLPIPVARDQMIDFLATGLGDIAVGNITITDERASKVDFSAPIHRNVSEILVHGVDMQGLDDVERRMAKAS